MCPRNSATGRLFGYKRGQCYQGVRWWLVWGGVGKGKWGTGGRMGHYFDRITITPGQCGGRACIRGMRI
ncbi:MAG: DUF433 domain-containing protein, partial [Magnetococcales bacterium]|nr:DUF433 domain-containing protein [Magnetococcales bacterium]